MRICQSENFLAINCVTSVSSKPNLLYSLAAFWVWLKTLAWRFLPGQVLMNRFSRPVVMPLSDEIPQGTVKFHEAYLTEE